MRPAETDPPLRSTVGLVTILIFFFSLMASGLFQVRARHKSAWRRLPTERWASGLITIYGCNAPSWQWKAWTVEDTIIGLRAPSL